MVSDQNSPGAGSPGVQQGPQRVLLRSTYGQLFQRIDGKLVRLVPLSQVKSLKGTDGTPRTDGKTIVSNALRPPTSAETCKLQLVSANHISSMPHLITVPMVGPPTPSGGTDLNIGPAASGGTHLNIGPAASGETYLNIGPAAFSETDLNIICVDDEPDVMTTEKHAGRARTSKDKPSSVCLLSDPIDLTTDSVSIDLTTDSVSIDLTTENKLDDGSPDTSVRRRERGSRGVLSVVCYCRCVTGFVLCPTEEREPGAAAERGARVELIQAAEGEGAWTPQTGPSPGYLLVSTVVLLSPWLPSCLCLYGYPLVSMVTLLSPWLPSCLCVYGYLFQKGLATANRKLTVGLPSRPLRR